MKRPSIFRTIAVACAAIVIGLSVCPAAVVASAKVASSQKEPPSYDRVIREADRLLKARKPQDAFLVASAAMTVDDKRWEAYAIASVALSAHGNDKEAAKYADEALKRAPESKRAIIASTKEKYAKKAKVAVDEQDDLASLKEILREAGKERRLKDRRELLEKFMFKSAKFLKDYPENGEIMVYRAATALELDLPCEGIAAANRLKPLSITQKNAPKAWKVMEQLKKKGWLSGFRRFPSCTTKAASEYGDAEAMFLVGENHYRGSDGVDKDHAKAMDWFRKAAAKGNADAEANLARIHLWGDGVVSDDGEAAAWARKSADKGNAVGQSILGIMYGEGMGFVRDKAKAAQWNVLANRAAKNDKLLLKELAALRRRALPEKRMNQEGVPQLAILNEKDLSNLVRIPAGSFKMGSLDKEGNRDEHPQHLVALDGYYIGSHEVTVDKYTEFCSKTKRKMPEQPSISRGNHPVVNVGWVDAKAYCEWAGMRLPTEAEWENAARGGVETRYWWGDNEPKNAANYGKSGNVLITLFNSNNGTMPAGSFPSNPYGLFDTSGNVAEWCADWYGDDYYKKSPSANPSGPESGKSRVIRGGTWNGNSASIRSAAREQFKPDLQNMTGFRCAK